MTKQRNLHIQTKLRASKQSQLSLTKKLIRVEDMKSGPLDVEINCNGFKGFKASGGTRKREMLQKRQEAAAQQIQHQPSATTDENVKAWTTAQTSSNSEEVMSINSNLGGHVHVA